MECYNINLCLYVKMRVNLQRSLDMPLFPDSMAHLFQLITLPFPVWNSRDTPRIDRKPWIRNIDQGVILELNRSASTGAKIGRHTYFACGAWAWLQAEEHT